MAVVLLIATQTVRQRLMGERVQDALGSWEVPVGYVERGAVLGLFEHAIHRLHPPKIASARGESFSVSRTPDAVASSASSPP